MVQVEGMLQIEAMDAAKRNQIMIMKNTLAQFKRSTTPSEQLPFEMKDIVIGEDSYLRLLITADATKTLDISASTVNIPVTQYIVAGGRGSAMSAPAEIMLTGADFEIVDTACTAAIPTQVGLYKVPAGTAIRPGWGEYSAMNTAKGRVYVDAVATA